VVEQLAKLLVGAWHLVRRTLSRELQVVAVRFAGEDDVDLHAGRYLIACFDSPCWFRLGQKGQDLTLNSAGEPVHCWRLNSGQTFELDVETDCNLRLLVDVDGETRICLRG